MEQLIRRTWRPSYCKGLKTEGENACRKDQMGGKGPLMGSYHGGVYPFDVCLSMAMTCFATDMMARADNLADHQPSYLRGTVDRLKALTRRVKRDRNEHPGVTAELFRAPRGGGSCTQAVATQSDVEDSGDEEDEEDEGTRTVTSRRRVRVMIRRRRKSPGRRGRGLSTRLYRWSPSPPAASRMAVLMQPDRWQPHVTEKNRTYFSLKHSPSPPPAASLVGVA